MNLDLLQKAANQARGLAMDAVHDCASGHLGLPLGCAEIGAVLFGDLLNICPAQPRWLNRDRFILSAGHGSMFLYGWLHLSGFNIGIEDLKGFRHKGSITPGHPEFRDTEGVECTTGPLGQGIANAVGFALSARRAAARFNKPGMDIFTQHIFCLTGDGCLQEGVARESVALLRNDGAMPFAANKAKRIAVVGPLADDAQNQLGDWTGNSGQVSWMPDGQPRGMITTVLDGLTQLTSDDCEVVYSRGANVIDLVPDPAGEFYPDGQPRPKIGVSAAVDRAMIDEAVANARQSDLIVAVVGDVVQLVGETWSTARLELLGGQNALLDALAAVSRETGKPMVTVLISSKPQVLPASIVGEYGVFAKRVSDPETGTGSILWAPNPGMRGGQAIAEIILGLTSPSGRLPITFPRHAGQLPVYYNQIRGQHGDRYADLTQDPAFAFGEGLSYTTFAYGEPTITGGASNADGTFAETDTVRAEITLTNTGDRKGTEVVQLYIGDIVTSYSWTDRELKAFQRVALEPGETKTVTFEIPVANCTIVDPDANRIVEPGEFELLIGHSSRREDLKPWRR